MQIIEVAATGGGALTGAFRVYYQDHYVHLEVGASLSGVEVRTTAAEYENSFRRCRSSIGHRCFLNNYNPRYGALQATGAKKQKIIGPAFFCDESAMLHHIFQGMEKGIVIAP